MKRYVLGFDIGGTKCAVILARVDDGIALLDRICFPTQSHLGYQQAKDRLFAAGHEMLDQHGISGKALLAVGISCGGPLDSHSGVVLSPPHLPGWDNIPIVKLAEEAFHVPAFLQNDANACALVEWKLGAARSTRNMIFLTMGTGFGAGIIAEERLLEGACGLAGEVGHVRLEADGPVAWGKTGPVEVYCSGAGVKTTARLYTAQMRSQGHTPAWIKDGLSEDEQTAKNIAVYAHRGDPDAIAVFNMVGEKLGKTLAMLIDLYNPECIVIGSIFVRCEGLLRPQMERVLHEEALEAAVKVCRVVPAQTGEQLGDYASILAALYPMQMEVTPYDKDQKPEVMAQFERLFIRYPALEALRAEIFSAFLTMRQTFSRDGMLLVCGNGGSAADAGHITGELMKGFLKRRRAEDTANMKLQKALRTIDLTQHNALNTAFSNDVDPDMIFAQQVYAYGRKGDTLLGISCSGNAKNVLEAAQTAKAHGLSVILLTGQDGGKIKEVSDVAICVPSDLTPDIQEYHLPVYHCLCAMLEADFF